MKIIRKYAGLPLWGKILVWIFVVYMVAGTAVGMIAAITGTSPDTLLGMPTPEPTIPLSPTPTPIPSVNDQIVYAIQNTGEVIYGDLKGVTYSKGTATVTYYISADHIWDNENARNQIKINSYYTERAIWQSFRQVDDVQVIVQGDLVDQYGNKSVGDLGRVDLTASTEKMFNWYGLDFDLAWGVYDLAWFNPAISS